LNFNFNMNDVFGSGKQGSVGTGSGKPPISLLKSNFNTKNKFNIDTIESKSLTDVLGGMKKQLDSQRKLLANALNGQMVIY
jgi:hypothetical protein